MCRHLAYLGPPRTLGSLLFDPPHSLARQSTHPTRQFDGATNLHGWGVGWWDDALRSSPSHHRTVTPILDDHTFRSRADQLEAGALVAAIRNASPGATLVETGNAPFAAGPWLFSLNGFIDGFFAGLGDTLRSLVSPARLDAIASDADSEVLFALVLDLLDAGAPPVDALTAVTHAVTDRTTGKLNLLLGDGRTIWATTHRNSLCTLHDEGLAVGGVLVASEPLDGHEGWADVPDDHVLEATPAGIHIHPRSTERELA